MKRTRWNTADELLEKWDMQPFELVELIRDGSLQPYAKDAVKELKIKHELTPDELRLLISKIDNPEHIPDNILERIDSNIQREHFDNDAFENGSELHEFLSKVIFKAEDVNDYEMQHGIGKITPDTETAPAPQAENYFKRNGKHWAIKFKNEFAAHVDHLDGFLFILHLLNNPGNAISDQKLYILAKGPLLNEVKNTMTVSEAIANGLNFDTPSQEINDRQAQNEYINQYQQLQRDLENAESNLEKKEIEDEIENLLPYLKRRNIPNPGDKKAQANMTRLLKRAYERISKENMPELAKHLEDSIKTGDYGRRYIGSVVWEIKY